MPRVVNDSEESEREVDDGLSDWERQAQQAPVQAPAKRLVFRDENNFSIGFILHKSLDKDEKRVLTRDIETHGGIVLDAEEEHNADTLLIHVRCGPVFKSTLQLAYHGHGDPSRSKIRVEFATFIRRCIESGNFKHSVPQIKGMGGIPGGYHRNEFTAGDDDMLCWYLSRLIPEKVAGGRLGLKIYHKLVDCADVMPEDYAWAKRHTAESWKQRYKTRRDEFDARIEEMVREEPPRDDQKWPEDRRMTKAAIKKHQRQYDSDNSWEGREPSEESDAEHQDQSDLEVESVMVSHKKRRPSGGQSFPRSVIKKQRMLVLQHSQRQEHSQVMTRINKGKEKAIEIEDEVQEQSERNSLFDGDIGHLDSEDPPAPNDLCSPERTLVATSRSHPHNGSPTQSRAHNQPGPINRPVQLMNQPVWLSPSTHSNPVQTLQSSPYRSPAASPQLSFPSSVQHPLTTSQLPKKAAYQRLPQWQSPRKKVDTIPEKHKELNKPPIGETLAEEMDVAKLLTRDVLDHSNTPNKRGLSMDTDDAHIDRSLHNGSASSQIRPLSGFNLLNQLPSDILKHFEASSSRRHSMLPTLSYHPTPNHPRIPQLSSRKPRQSAPSHLQHSDIRGFKLLNPWTPPQQEQDRDTSAELFPPSRTRARMLREELAQREKGTPYRPPARTRAAQMADAL